MTGRPRFADVRQYRGDGLMATTRFWLAEDTTTFLSACGQTVGPEEIAHVREVAGMCSGLSRTELALTLCEHWGWVGATGKPQRRACEKVLDRLAEKGLVELPAKRKLRPRSASSAGCSKVPCEDTAPGLAVECDLRSVRPVRLERVDDSTAVAVWNAFVERYHALGFKRPFGCWLRYYVASSRGRLGCILLAGGARALRCRDEWIGWSAQQRLANLPLVINNSRFLVFPWVRVPHLASHVLGLLARQVRDDWRARWGYRPVLMETFVDPAQHRGVCYRAAGWNVLGETTGEGLRLRGHTYRTSRKHILVRPLVRDFRTRLLSRPEPEDAHQ